MLTGLTGPVACTHTKCLVVQEICQRLYSEQYHFHRIIYFIVDYMVSRFLMCEARRTKPFSCPCSRDLDETTQLYPYQVLGGRGRASSRSCKPQGEGGRRTRQEGERGMGPRQRWSPVVGVAAFEHPLLPDRRTVCLGKHKHVKCQIISVLEKKKCRNKSF